MFVDPSTNDTRGPSEHRTTSAGAPGERFLVERWEVPVPEAPDGIAIIGADPEDYGN